jgi:hypothetical protein
VPAPVAIYHDPIKPCFKGTYLTELGKPLESHQQRLLAEVISVFAVSRQTAAKSPDPLMFRFQELPE